MKIFNQKLKLIIIIGLIAAPLIAPPHGAVEEGNGGPLLSNDQRLVRKRKAVDADSEGEDPVLPENNDPNSIPQMNNNS